MDRVEPSLGRELSADWIFLNSPDVVVPGRTTIAPEGGEVRKAACTKARSAEKESSERNIFKGF